MSSFPIPTVVRIKRRIGTESSESIIVSSKKKRLNEDDPTEAVADIYSTVLKKLTTLDNDGSFEVEAKKALESEPKHSWELKEHFKKGLHSLPKELVKRKSKSEVAAIRFKLICSKRNLDEKSEESDSSKQDVNFHMLDALKEKEENALVPLASSSKNEDSDVIHCNGVPMQTEKIEYVYDLYYGPLPFELSCWVDNICEIQKCSNALEYFPEGSDDSSELEDEDDENAESNWRNDYPDEEETEYFEDVDEYLCHEMQKAKLTDSDESYDADEYDDAGDFDEDGNLLLYNQSKSVFKHSTIDDESASSSEEGND